MKKSKILAIVLSVLFITAALTAFPVSAMSEGFDDLAGAVQGKNPIMNPEYIAGGAGFSDTEGSASLFVYDEDSDMGKYCTEQLPYWAEWKYDKEYIVNRIVFRTGNDSAASPRRMGDGYTISGSNDGTAWTVIYTGKEDDTDAADDMYYYIDLPDNAASYQYYRLNADTAGVSIDDGGINDRALIQYSMLILCSDAAPAYAAPWKPTSYKIGADKTVINAVDFDAEPFNNVNTAEAQWNVRTDMAEVTGPQTEVGESQFGSNIGWIEVGEWVQYTVRFDTDGKYKFDAYQASGSDTPGNVAVYIDDILVGESPDTVKADDGTWQTYDIYPVGEAEVTAGSHVIKVEFPKGGLNFAAFEVTKTGDLAAPETEAPTEAVTDAADADNTDANAATEAADADADDDGSNNNIWLWVGIGAAVVIVIIIIAVLLTKKKKPAGK